MSDLEERISAMQARLERVEAQLQFLFRRLGITAGGAPAAKASPAVIGLLGRGDKKGAIRTFMEETGAGLKDAKTFIESLMAGPTE